MRRSHGTRGFTLVEVLIAMLLTALVLASVMGVLTDAMNSRDHIHNISQIQRTGPMILDMIEADLRAIAPYNVAGRRVLLGRKLSIRGADADALDFVALREGQLETVFSDSVLRTERPLTPPLCEVGWHLKQNRREPVFMELWRREDPLLDDEPFKGGSYTKVYDKITNFKVTYFAEPGTSARSEDSWASEEKEMLPQRLQIDLELEIEPRVEGTDRPLDARLRRSFRRVFNVDPDYNRVLLANVRPRIPDPPKADDNSAGGNPGNLPGGPGMGNLPGGGGKGGSGGAGQILKTGGAGQGGNPFGGSGSKSPTPPPGFGGGALGGGKKP